MAADVRYFLELVGADKGGNGGEAGGGGKAQGLLAKVLGKGNQDVKKELQKGDKGARKSLGATLGIKFGIASLLKQSQVFTGFIGTIFQLMGALVDVILAPFLPVLIPGIRLIADMIPIVSKYAQAVYNFLDGTIFAWFKSLPIPDWIKEKVKEALSAILVGVVMLKVIGLWTPFVNLVTNFIGKPLWGLLKSAAGFPGKIFRLFGTSFLDDVGKGVKAGVSAIWDSTGGKLVQGVKAAWKAVVKSVWTDGLNAKFVGPILTRTAGLGALITSPFKTLWSTVTGNVSTATTSLISRMWSSFAKQPVVRHILGLGRFILNGIGELGTRLMGTSVMKALSRIPQHLTDLFNWLPRMIKGLPIIGTLAQFLKVSLKKLLGGLFKGVVGAAKGVGKLVQKNVAPGLKALASPKTLLKAGNLLKAVPVLGAVAELGYGAYATYKDYQKYGLKGAGARMALTAANVGTALIDPSGIASAAGSITSNVALDYAMRKKFDVREDWARQNPELTLKIAEPDGSYRYIMKSNVDRERAVAITPSQAKDRSVDYEMG